MKTRRIKLLLFVLAAVLPVLGCDGDTPTAPPRASTAAAVATATAIPTATPTPLPGPLAAVEFTLVDTHNARSAYRHAFKVHFDVRETRGIPISVTPLSVESRGGGYAFPNRESGFQEFRVAAFGSVSFDTLVEHGEDVSCSAGLLVGVNVESADGMKAQFKKEFNCTTGYWPL